MRMALEDEAVCPPHGLGRADVDLAVGKCGAVQATEPDAEDVRHL